MTKFNVGAQVVIGGLAALLGLGLIVAHALG
jgi:hypothetical protein